MAEYISKQDVIDYLNGYLHSIGECGADSLLFDRGQRRALINSIQDISAVKAADVQPVRRGEWIKQEGFWNKNTVKCSLCGNYLDMDGVNGGRGDANYCPNCGAEMLTKG